MKMEFELVGGPFDGERRLVLEGNRLMIQVRGDDGGVALWKDGESVEVPQRRFAVYALAGPRKYQFTGFENRLATDLVS